MSQGYEQRKTLALVGVGVGRRDDPSLLQWNASDKWNRHHYHPKDSTAPLTTGEFAPFLHFPSDARLCGADVPLDPQHLQMVQSVSKQHLSADVPTESHHHPRLQATEQWGFYRVPQHDLILELAPDQSRYALPNAGDIGRMFFH